MSTTSSGTSSSPGSGPTACSVGPARPSCGWAWARRSPARTIRPGVHRTALRAELIEQGEIVPVEVEGLGRTLRRSAGELPRPRCRRGRAGGGPPRPGGRAPGLAFLAPLDPFVWDRDLLRSLFGFDYIWEVYVPEKQASLGLLRPADPVRRPARRPDRAADRPQGGCAAGPRPVVGGRLRPARRRRASSTALAAALEAHRSFGGLRPRRSCPGRTPIGRWSLDSASGSAEDRRHGARACGTIPARRPGAAAEPRRRRRSDPMAAVRRADATWSGDLADRQGHRQRHLERRLQRPGHDLGVAGRVGRRPDEPRGAAGGGPRVVLLDGLRQ